MTTTYDLFAQAIAGRKQVSCTYDGHPRKLCVHILGHNKAGHEVALIFQFGGRSSQGLHPGGEWRCLHLSKVTAPELHDGPWRGGSSHRRPQACVDVVDLDVNPSSPYRPKRGQPLPPIVPISKRRRG